MRFEGDHSFAVVEGFLIVNLLSQSPLHIPEDLGSDERRVFVIH